MDNMRILQRQHIKHQYCMVLAIVFAFILSSEMFAQNTIVTVPEYVIDNSQLKTVLIQYRKDNRSLLKNNDNVIIVSDRIYADYYDIKPRIIISIGHLDDLAISEFQGVCNIDGYNYMIELSDVFIKKFFKPLNNQISINNVPHRIVGIIPQGLLYSQWEYLYDESDDKLTPDAIFIVGESKTSVHDFPAGTKVLKY